MSPIFIDRDTLNDFASDAIGQTADLLKQAIGASPPPQPVTGPPPAPPDTQQPPQQPDAVQAPTSSDSLTNPILQSPPPLQDFLATAGLTPQPSGGAADTATSVPAAPVTPQPPAAFSPPPLADFLSSAGLGDLASTVGGATTGAASAASNAVQGASQAVSSLSPPPLPDFLKSAGLGDQSPATTSPSSNPVQAATQTVSQAASQVQQAVQDVGSKIAARTSQFGMGLDAADAMAFCGPAAAMAFAQTYGRNPTVSEAKALAQKVGWNPDQGMAGIGSEQQLLQGMGIQTKLEQQVDWSHVAQDAASGNPVILSTPGHYYYVNGVRTNAQGQTEFDVGTSGTDLRGGSEWMTSDQINAMPQSHGPVAGALYADHPSSPTPSPTASGSSPRAPDANAQMPQVQMDASTPEAFIRSITPAAQWVQDKTGIPAAAMIGMAANETGYGKYADGNNLFGIKGSNPDTGANTGPVGTWEVVNGVRQNISDTFRAYDNVAQSFMDFANLIQNSPRYAAALGQQSVEGFVGALKAGGYMTDPDYVSKISNIVQHYAPVINDALQNAPQMATGAASAVGSAAQGAVQGAQKNAQGLLDNANNLVSQGQTLINNATSGAQSAADQTGQKLASINDEANRQMAANQAASDQTLADIRSRSQQDSLNASQQSTLTPTSPVTASLLPPGGGPPNQDDQTLPVWQRIGNTIANAISQGLQPLFQGAGSAVTNAAGALPTFNPPLDPNSPVARLTRGEKPQPTDLLPSGVAGQASQGLAEALTPGAPAPVQKTLGAVLNPANLAFGGGGFASAATSALAGQGARALTQAAGGDQTAQDIAETIGGVAGGFAPAGIERAAPAALSRGLGALDVVRPPETAYATTGKPGELYDQFGVAREQPPAASAAPVAIPAAGETATAGRQAAQVPLGPDDLSQLLSRYPEDIKSGLRDFVQSQSANGATGRAINDTLRQWVQENPLESFAASTVEQPVAISGATAASRAPRTQAPGTQAPAAPAANPFLLRTEPGPGVEPITTEQAADYLASLESRYTANDARIQDLENRVSGGTLNSASVGVIRPPWGAGLTNEALRDIARAHNVDPATPDWWERANLFGNQTVRTPTGTVRLPASGEFNDYVAPGGFRGVGTAQQTPTQARAELRTLQTENDQIMAAVEHAYDNGGGQLYRPAAPEALPFDAGGGSESSAPTDAGNAAANAGGASGRAPTATEPDASSAAINGNPVAAQGSPVATAKQAIADELSAPVATAPAQAAPASPIPAPAPVKNVASQLGADTDPSRAFDLNALSDMRAKYASQQPPLLGAQAPKRTPLDNFIGYTMSNMLWGVSTAVHITTSQILQTLGRPAVEAASGHPVEAVRDFASMGDALSSAFSGFGRTLKTGERQGFALQTPPLPGAAGTVLGFPLRAHSAINEFFRTLNSAGASAAEASRLLRQNPDLSFQDVLQRYPQQIMDSGADAAARATFMKGGGAMAELGRQFGSMSRRMMDSDNPASQAAGLALRWVVPMTHIPAVILGEGVRALPVVNEVRGLQRTVQLARGTPEQVLSSGQKVPAIAGDAYQAQQELGRTALTSLANFAILSEVAQGNITGSGPSSPAERERLMEAVDQNGNAMWRPNSIRLPGGRWFDYTGLGPIALPMAAIANGVDTAKDYANKPAEQKQQGPAQVPEFIGEMLNREVGTIGSTWFLRGLADTLTMIKEGNVSTAAGSEIGSIGDRLVPFGSLLNEVRGFTDPYQRNPQNPLERVESRIPILSSNVEPRIAASTGQPMGNAQDVGSFLFRGTPPGQMASNPVGAEVARLHDQGLNVSLPYEVKSYKGATQTPGQQQDIRQQVGTAVNLYVSHTLADPKYAGLTDQQKAQAISQAVGQAQSAADITLSGNVARSPHDSALLQWAQTAHYAGISSQLPPDQIAQQNWAIQQAKAKLADYRKQYGNSAEGQLRRDDPAAYRLSQRDNLDPEVLARKKRAVDQATGGALSQAEQQPATGGLVGVGSTTLP